LVEAGRENAGMISTPLAPAGIVARIDELLEARYRSADLGNLDDPLAEAVYILISQQTRESVYRQVFASLRARFPLWSDVLRADAAEVESVLEPAGFQRRKTVQLRALLQELERENRKRGIGPAADPPGDLTLDFLNDLPDGEAESFLTSLPGIGPKSARCVLSYALGRSVFAVDTHVHRIFTRIGLVPTRGRKSDHDPFQDAVPPRLRKRLHINLVHHGRAVCDSQRPRCNECVLVSFCAKGRRAVADADSETPTAVELFAGAGGMGEGFRRAGFRIALAVEADRHAAQTYRLNHPGVPVVEAKVDAGTTAAELRKFMPGVDRIACVAAGVPCQGYSAAGPRRADDERNELYRHVVRVARQLKSETICIENVPGLKRVGGHGFLDAILAEMRAAGYAAEAHLLRACEFGVPQHRLRYFFLGQRGRRHQAPPHPASTHCPRHDTKKSGDTRAQTPRLADELKKIPKLGAGEAAERIVDASGNELLNASTMLHSQRVIDKISAIKAGEGPMSYRRLELDEARTLIAGHRALPVHPELDRTISVREAALIQGFPLTYFFCGPRAEQPLQVANAVPPALAEAVGNVLLTCVSRK
jgi:DNA (cytosine-5)-methyltransferase 1